MTKNFNIKAINISEDDFKKVKEFKYKYIDFMNFSGVFYSSIRFVSAVMNNMLENFNKQDELNLPIGGFEARQWDLDQLRLHGAEFLRVLKTKKIDESIFEHVEDVFNRAVDELEKMTIEAREARELAAQTENTQG